MLKKFIFFYIACLGIGALLIVGAIHLFKHYPNYLADEILLSTGCSTIPTVVTAYLIDQASEKKRVEENSRIAEPFYERNAARINLYNEKNYREVLPT